MAGTRRRESFAEQRERRAEVVDPQVVLEAALRFLETRQRSVAEVRRRLMSTGYQPSLVEGAITRLLDLALLDDEAFARAWVESRDRAHPRGERALRTELVQRGLERDIVDGVLGRRRDAALVHAGAEGEGPATIQSVDDQAAWRLLNRRARSIAGASDPRARRQRAFGLLARHGFDVTTATAVATAWAARLDDASEAGPGDELEESD